MEAVLIGAPGSGARGVGRALAERRGARFVDLTGDPARRPDVVSGVRLAEAPDAGPALRRVIAADRIVADTALRARLFRGRHVVWLDVPADQLVERLRAVRRADLEIQGDLRTYTLRHRAEYEPYYAAGTRIDGSGSIAATINRIDPVLSEPVDSGTLVLRAALHDGLIELGEGILRRSLAHVLDGLAVRRGVVVTSPRSRARADAAVGMARDAGCAVDIEELPDGEPSKVLANQESLFRRLAELRLERGDPLIAIGDETVLEAAIFTAAVWLRGVPLIMVPVTTQGLIDTSIGGKGGINLPGVGRNLLGSFHNATATILDIALTSGEPEADRRAALAEAVKYGLVSDEGILALLENAPGFDVDGPGSEATSLLELVERCALAKRRAVIEDERDTGDIRIALNLGHTLSHALEAATGYRMRHGEAVAYGLRASLAIGTSMGITPPSVAARAARLLRRLDLGQEPINVPVPEVLEYIEADKKRRDGKLRWVLVGKAGAEVHEDVPPAVAGAAISAVLTGTTTRAVEMS